MSDKKRFSVSLDEDVAERVKDMIRALRLRPGMFSEILDESLKSVLPVMEEMAASRSSKASFSSRAVLKAAFAQEDLPLE